LPQAGSAAQLQEVHGSKAYRGSDDRQDHREPMTPEPPLQALHPRLALGWLGVLDHGGTLTNYVGGTATNYAPPAPAPELDNRQPAGGGGAARGAGIDDGWGRPPRGR